MAVQKTRMLIGTGVIKTVLMGLVDGNKDTIGIRLDATHMILRL